MSSLLINVVKNFFFILLINFRASAHSLIAIYMRAKKRYNWPDEKGKEEGKRTTESNNSIINSCFNYKTANQIIQ